MILKNSPVRGPYILKTDIDGVLYPELDFSAVRDAKKCLTAREQHPAVDHEVPLLGEVTEQLISVQDSVLE